MKIYGEGLFIIGDKVVYDFIDGPFETDDRMYIEKAKECGFSVGEPASVVQEEIREDKPRRGRKPK